MRSNTKEIQAMKKVINIAFALLFAMSTVAMAGEGPSQDARDTIKQDQQKRGDAGDGIGLGPEKLWRVSPGFKYSTAYDSNVNREPRGSEDHDIIMNFIPSIGLSRIGSKFGIVSDYEMKYKLYFLDSDQNGFDHIFNHSMWYESDKMTAKVKESFGYVKTYATSEQSERRTILFNDINPELIYNLTSKFSVSGLYQNYLLSYRDSQLKENSYIKQDFGGRVYYHATAKTDLFVQGSGIVTDYYNSGLYDARGFGVYGGAIGKVTDKTTLFLKTGFEGREYQNDAINSFYNWVGELGARYSLTSKTDATLLVKRGIEESVYQNTGWYSFDKVNLNLGYHATTTITAELGGGFQNNRYPRQTLEGISLRKRNDSIVLGSSKLIWEPIHDFELAVGYIFSKRFSNFNEFDYIDHLVEASTSFKF